MKFINFSGKDFYDYKYIHNQFLENNGKTEQLNLCQKIITEQLNRILKH